MLPKRQAGTVCRPIPEREADTHSDIYGRTPRSLPADAERNSDERHHKRRKRKTELRMIVDFVAERIETGLFVSRDEPIELAEREHVGGLGRRLQIGTVLPHCNSFLFKLLGHRDVCFSRKNGDRPPFEVPGFTLERDTRRGDHLNQLPVAIEVVHRQALGLRALRLQRLDVEENIVGTVPNLVGLYC